MTRRNDLHLSMAKLAQSYVGEMQAKFRTLNLFVQHAGEIGRAHEHFLREAIKRFLPFGHRIASGFIVSPGWTSPQQDIVIFDASSSAPLFEIGDCAVVYSNSVKGCIEVKTTLVIKKKENDDDAIRKLMHLYRNLGGISRSLYAWEGPPLETTLEHIWTIIRGDLNMAHALPDDLYVHGRYLIKANHDGKLLSHPFKVLDIEKAEQSDMLDGVALLVISNSWNNSVTSDVWNYRTVYDVFEDKFQPIHWPDDIASRLEEPLPAQKTTK
jgi:hypothetical protein